MTFKSKRKLVMMLMGLIVCGCYIAFALGSKAPATEDISAWAIAILKFIGITLVAAIVTQIVFHIIYAIGVSVKEGVKKGIEGEELDDKKTERLIHSTVVEDEMDKKIEMKASTAGYVCVGVGFVVMLFVLANAFPFLWGLHTMFIAVMLANFLEGIVSIWLYERGV